ncbi:MAG: tyrosine-type recombinase/integrase [Verrucomicrobia bacterium]|nr:tyrosine-type recombinase/integrase [Verrucomicrobiota bacterium]
MNQKSVQDSSTLGHFSKSDVRYWQRAIFRQSYTRNGQTFLTSSWAMKVAHEGRRSTFNLGTPNKAAAAAKARDIYLFLAANGWAAASARYKKTKPTPPGRAEQPVTVGEFLDEVSRTASNQRTVEGYAKALRQIVSQSFGLASGTEKYDYRNGGQSKWLEKVHSIKLAEMTPSRVQEWKRSFLANAGTDPLELRRARISVNSLVRQARSLFAAKRIRHLQLSLPNPLPFDGVDFEPRQSMKYRSEINVAALIKAAKAELRHSLPEAYKVFLLAVGVGLRKKEIDLLEWRSFRWEENVIRIEATRYFHPKSEDSIADLPVDREVMAIFRTYHERAKAPFVIKSKRPPLPSKPQQYYRCEPIFEEVNSWLRKYGVDGGKPLHTLRKEYGSLLTRSYGIHAASRALRHADLRTTSEHYSDSTARVTPGIGRLIGNRSKRGKAKT